MLQGLLLLYIVVGIMDLISATNARACSEPGAGASCYPWGAEGPVAGVWSYETRELYYVGSVMTLQLTLMAFVVPFLVQRGRQSALIIGVLLLLHAAGSLLLGRIIH